jgi:hypothetical protein
MLIVYTFLKISAYTIYWGDGIWQKTVDGSNMSPSGIILNPLKHAIKGTL